MRENEFILFLNADANIISKSNTIKSRVNKAKMIERHFNQSLEELVSDDKIMYEALLKIKREMKDKNGTVTNALRKYYQFQNNCLFPTLKDYEAKRGNI